MFHDVPRRPLLFHADLVKQQPTRAPADDDRNESGQQSSLSATLSHNQAIDIAAKFPGKSAAFTTC